VAKLEPSDASQKRNSSVLLNCHFDSKPGSPGATDNIISCSVMLEILRVLSTQPNLVIKNNIVFLFNGAEELGLQGAHGFVRGKTNHLDTEQGHPWSQDVKVFINLEGAGAGGREILFQATGGMHLKIKLSFNN
jgi:Zn-dependent M28 family amino/carboxypeptidase